MYLATLHVTLDLDPEVALSERAKVLRSLRDKLKQHYGYRITIRTDDDAGLAVAFFDENYGPIKSRIKDVIDAIDGAGEARISVTQGQVFCWYDGRFQETRESLASDCDQTYGAGSGQDFDGGNNGRESSTRRGQPKTIVYNNDDDDALAVIPPSGGFNRRNVRLPTRK